MINGDTILEDSVTQALRGTDVLKNYKFPQIRTRIMYERTLLMKSLSY